MTADPNGQGGASDLAALRAEVESRTWFHSIDLGNGIVTPGQKDTPTEAAVMQIPADLTGKTVLDIGAYDGFYSFEAERRGAARVVAADHWTWNWPGSDARRNFDLAREVLGSRVEAVDVPVEELSPDRVGGTFDVVLFLGVLYHAPDPLGYLKRVRSVTKGFAIVETVVDLLDVGVPAAAYYPGASLNNDGSNHFGPNPACIDGMLKDAGFSQVTAFDPWSVNWDYAIRPWKAPPSVEGSGKRSRWRRNRFTAPTPRSGRQTFYAHP